MARVVTLGRGFTVKKWVIALVIGVMMALGSAANVSENDTIKCGSATMGPGDVCEESRGGSTVETRTYDEMKESSEARARMFNSWGRWALLGAGLALAIAGLAGIRATRKRRAATAAGQPQAVPTQFAPPQQAPYPQVPHQQYPPAVQNTPYPQQQPYPPQQQYPPQGFGPTGHQG
jgi:hypothetical protein